MKNENGFTLAEILVAMVIGMMVLVSIYSAVNMAQKSSSGMEKKIGGQQDVKTALDMMEMELQMASYNPTFVTGLWRDPTTCAVSANQNYQGIQEATQNAITIELDLDNSSVVGNAANEIIRYNYDTTNLYFTREVKQNAACNPGGQPFLGDSVAGQKTVRVINASLGIPVFNYIDGSGTDITALLPAQIPNIRRINITLAVETENIDPMTKQRRRMIYSTSVLLRNHGL